MVLLGVSGGVSRCCYVLLGVARCFRWLLWCCFGVSSWLLW